MRRGGCATVAARQHRRVGSRGSVEYRILGPLEVSSDGGGRVALQGAKQRALLAVLLLRRGEVVPTDQLLDELYGDDLPAAATKTIQVHVSRLRRALGDDAIRTHPGG